MLFLAKADNKQLMPNQEPIELAEDVASLLEFYGMLAEEKEIQVTLVGKGVVTGDRLMLRRALGNLLSNAIRHATPHTAVEVSIQAGVKSIEICVLNTGDAIAPEHLERVFERFFRVDPSRQISSEGTGLGLAITKSIVAAHGGTITVTSSDKHTVFRVFLPR